MKNKINLKLNLGFTLIETLVVVSSFAIMVGGITGLLMMITRTNKKTETVLDLRRQGDNVIFAVNRKAMMGIGFSEIDSCYEGDVINKESKSVDFLVYSNFVTEEVKETELSCGSNNIVLDGTELIDDTSLDVQSCDISCYNNNSINLSFELKQKYGSDVESFSTFILMRNAEK